MRTVPGAVPARDGSTAAPLAFDGSAGAFFRLVLAGGLLQLVTLGFYRFWLITDIRRHLWQHTRIGPDSFEYTGTARELLLGFLLALAVLAPVYVLYFLAGLVAEQIKAFASTPLALSLYVFGQYAAFRARRYRLSRTLWRGLRFSMVGSGWAYAARAFGWDLLTGLTLGLAYPWRATALERYKTNNTRYGSLAGRFVGTGGQLFKRGVWIWLAGVAVVALSVAAIVILVNQGRTAPGPAFGSLTPGGLMLIAGLDLIALFLLYGLFQGVVLRWKLDGLRFGEAAVTSTLGAGAALSCYVKAAAAMVVCVAAVGALALLLGGSIQALTGFNLSAIKATRAGDPAGQLAGIAAMAAFYLVILTGFGVIKRTLIDRGLWVAAARSATLTSLAALDAVKADDHLVGALGEGLADALDIGAI